MRKLTFASLLLSFLVIGCAAEGSYARNVSHPARKDFTIGELKIAVVPQSNHWSAWYVAKFLENIPPLPLIKEAEIKAIERYSGCKVTSADFVQTSIQPAYLQAIVSCK